MDGPEIYSCARVERVVRFDMCSFPGPRQTVMLGESEFDVEVGSLRKNKRGVRVATYHQVLSKHHAPDSFSKNN